MRSNAVDPDPRVEKVAKSLTEADYSVQVFAWDRKGGSLPKQEKDGYNITRTRIKAKFGSGLSNLLPLIIWQVRCLMWLIKNSNQYQVVHACDFDTVIPALLIKFIARKKVVYDIFDFYADAFRIPKYLYQIVRNIDFLAIKLVDAVIIADESRKAQIFGSKPKKLEVIYNSPEVLQKFEGFERERIPDRLRIAYIGILNEERKLIEIINLIRSKPHWILDIAGFGELDVGKLALNASNITFHGKVDYQKALEISSESDLLFAIYDPKIPNHRFSSANKLFEAMMLGKPIVVAKNTGMDEKVKKHNLGLVINYDDMPELEKAFNDIDHWSELEKKIFADHAKKVYAEFFSWEIMKNRLKNLYWTLG